MKDSPAPFSAVLMAGGKSQRMGRDKATLTVPDGRALWERQVELLRMIRPAELFVSGRADGPWAGADLEVVPDAAADAGPLGGLVAVMRQMRTERLLVLAVDLPRMTREFLERLIERAECVVPVNGGRYEPLGAVYPKSALGFLEEALAAGELSLQRCVERLVKAGLIVEWNVESSRERECLQNANTLEEWADAWRQ